MSELLPRDVRTLTAWRRPDSVSQFRDLRGWLAYTGGTNGPQASLSRHLSASDLKAMGEGIGSAYMEMVDAAAPLFEYCFSGLEPAVEPDDEVPAVTFEVDDEADDDLPTAVFDVATLRTRASGAPHHLQIDGTVYQALIAAVLSGKHVILTGPPGTAKTTLAEVLCQLASDARQCRGYQLTTATADWTTYETIGGLRPAGNGMELKFTPGLFLESASAGQWLIVDELNRSNFDRAFGQLFTLLSGQSVVLPYDDHATGKRIVLALQDSHLSYSRERYSIIEVPRGWRIIATMNVFDKSLLFEMSYALMRRFAFIEVPAPATAVYEAIWRKELDGLADAEIAKISGVLTGLETLRLIKEIGPAVFADMARFARHYPPTGGNGVEGELAFQMFYSFLLPQFEGIDGRDGEALFRTMRPLLDDGRHERLKTCLREVLGVILPADNPAEPADGAP